MKKPLPAFLLPLIALLSGVGLLVIGTGLLFTVLGIQAGIAKFTPFVTGFIMSAYFAGFVHGTFSCPKIIRSVGHIRAFAALASIASTLPILHALWLNPMFWAFLRYVTGFCIIGLFLVVESWLTMVTPQHRRGRVFAIYMMVNGIGIALGQWLNFSGDKFDFTPFVFVSVLFSFALLPITLATVQDPETLEAPHMPLWSLIDVSRVGSVTAIITGLVNSAFYSLGNVFGQSMGFSSTKTAMFMTAVIMGGVALQYPIGRYSDKRDRRKVITQTSILSSVLALACFAEALYKPGWLLVLLAFFYGGFSMVLYGLSVARVQDLISPDRVLEATGSVLLLYGIGATAGPFIAGGLMEWLGPESLMLYFAACCLFLSVWSWYFTRVIPDAGKGAAQFQPMGASSTPPLHVEILSQEAQSDFQTSSNHPPQKQE
jgi:MFS family permease